MGLGASFRAEALKLRKRPTTWVLVGLVLFCVLFFDYLSSYGTYLQVEAGVTISQVSPELLLDAMLPHQFIRAVMNTVVGEGSAIALIFGALVAGSEYGWGTLKTALVGGPPRLSIYGGQVLALAVTLAALTPATYAAAAGASLLIAQLQGGVSTIPNAYAWPSPGQIASALAVTYLILAMSAAFGLMLATLLRATAPAVGLGLAWLFVIEATIETFAFESPLLGGILPWLPGANVLSLSTTFGSWGGSDFTPVAGPVKGSAAQFSLVLLVYVVVFLAVGALVFRRRDAG